MAGGMRRRRSERLSLHQRIHGISPPAEPEPAPARTVRPPIRHCWVTDEHGRLPGLLLEWQQTDSGWQGRVVRPVLEGGLGGGRGVAAGTVARPELLTHSHAEMSRRLVGRGRYALSLWPERRAKVRDLVLQLQDTADPYKVESVAK